MQFCLSSTQHIAEKKFYITFKGSDTDCMDFMFILNYFDILQHINFSMHTCSHTLDLICSAGIDNVYAQGQ